MTKFYTIQGLIGCKYAYEDAPTVAVFDNLDAAVAHKNSMPRNSYYHLWITEWTSNTERRDICDYRGTKRD